MTEEWSWRLGDTPSRVYRFSNREEALTKIDEMDSLDRMSDPDSPGRQLVHRQVSPWEDDNDPA